MTGWAETRALARNRAFRLVWIGETTSSLGNGMSQLAYPLLMLMLTESPLAAGLLAAVRAVPYLALGLIAGALVDRWNRKRTMIVCDLVRAISMASIPAALLMGVLTPAQLYVTGFIGGVAYVFSNAAQVAVLPNIVQDGQLARAISLQETAEGITGIAAAPIGGALLQWARGLPFLVDAVSFLISALCFLRVRGDFRSEAAPRPDGRLLGDIMSGLRWLRRQRSLRLIVVVAAGLQFAISAIALVAIVIARESGASASTTGIMFSATGLGAVIGASLAPAVTKRLGVGGAILAVLWLHAGLWVLLAFARSLLVVAVALGLFTLTMPWFGIAAYHYQLRVTPDELRSRVGTSFNLLLWAAAPIAGGLAGFLLDAASVTVTTVFFCAWVLVLAIVATTVGRLHRVEVVDG